MPGFEHFVALDYDDCLAEAVTVTRRDNQAIDGTEKTSDLIYAINTAHPLYIYLKGLLEAGKTLHLLNASSRVNDAEDQENHRLKHNGYAKDALDTLVSQLGMEGDGSVIHHLERAETLLNCRSKLQIVCVHLKLIASMPPIGAETYCYTLIDDLGSQSGKAHMLDGLSALFSKVRVAVPMGITLRLKNYIPSDKPAVGGQRIVPIGEDIVGCGAADYQMPLSNLFVADGNSYFDDTELNALYTMLPEERPEVMQVYINCLLRLVLPDICFALRGYMYQRFATLRENEKALFQSNVTTAVDAVHVSCRIINRAPTLTTRNPRAGISKIRAAYRLLQHVCQQAEYDDARLLGLRDAISDEALQLRVFDPDETIPAVQFTRCDTQALRGAGNTLSGLVSEHASALTVQMRRTLGVRVTAPTPGQ